MGLRGGCVVLRGGCVGFRGGVGFKERVWV